MTDLLKLVEELAAEAIEARDDGDRRRWIAETAVRLRAVFPEDCDDVEAWPTCELLMGSASVVVDRAREAGVGSPEVAWLLERIATYTACRGDLNAARSQLEPSISFVDAAVAEGDPLRVRVRTTFGSLLNDLDEYASARAVIEEALVLNEHAPVDDALAAEARLQLGLALEGMGDLDAACREMELAVALLAQALPGSRAHVYALRSLGWTHYVRRDAPGARDRIEEAMAIALGRFPPDHPDVAKLRVTLGVVLLELGDTASARAELTRAVEDIAAALGDDHPEVGVARSNLSDALVAEDALQDAKRQLALSLESAGRALPASHAAFHIRHGKLASVLHKLGDYKGEVEQYERALAVTRLAAGPTAPQAARDLEELATARMDADDLAGASSAFEEALEVGFAAPETAELPLSSYARAHAVALMGLRDLPGALSRLRQALALDRNDDPDDPQRITDRLLVASILHELQEHVARGYEALDRADLADAGRAAARAAVIDAAERTVATRSPELSLLASRSATAVGELELARRALEQEEIVAPKGDWPELPELLADSWHELGRACVRQAAWEGAGHAFERRLALLEVTGEPDLHLVGVTLHDLAYVRDKQGRRDEAIALYARAAESKRTAGRESLDLEVTLKALARALADTARFAEAQDAYEECLRILKATPAPDPSETSAVLQALAEVHHAQRRPDAAVELCGEAVELRRQGGPPRGLASSLLALARALVAAGRGSEAEAAYRECLDVVRAEAEPDPQWIGVALHGLADIRRAAGESEAAADLYEQAAQHKRRAQLPHDLAVTLQLLALTSMACNRREAARSAAAEAASLLEGVGEARGELVRMLAVQAHMSTTRADVALRLLARVHEMADDAALEPWTKSLCADTYEQLGYGCEARLLRGQLAAALDERIATGEHEDPDGLLRVAQLLIAGSAFDAARLVIEGAVAAAGEEPAPEMLGKLASGWHVLGYRLRCTGDYEAAALALGQSLALRARAEDRGTPGTSSALYYLADVRRAQGLLDEAIDDYRRAADVELRAGVTRQVSIYLIGCGRALLALGDVDGAAGAFEQALEIERGLAEEEPYGASNTMHDLATARIRQGRSQEAVELLHSAAERKRSYGDCTHSLGITLVTLTRALWAVGARADAAEIAEEATSLTRGSLHTPVRMVNRRDELLLQRSPAWPDANAASQRVAAVLTGLSPAAVALLERRYVGAPAGEGGSAASLEDELRKARLLKRKAPELSRSGRVAGGLLRAAGAPDAQFAAWLRLDAPGDRFALDARMLLARLALASRPPTTAALLDGLRLSVRAGHAQLDTLDTVSAIAVVALCRDDDRAREAARASIAQLAARGETRSFPALCIALVDLDELEQAQDLLERAGGDHDGAEAGGLVGPEMTQLALAWHWLGVGREAADELSGATAAYERCADCFLGCQEVAHRGALENAIDTTHAPDEVARVRTRVRESPWKPTYDTREHRIASLMQLSRAQAQLGERLAARATLALTAVDLRLLQPGGTDVLEGGRGDVADADAALGALSPAAVALLERLRRDEAASRELSVAPGLTASPEDAWLVLRSAEELRSAGLSQPDTPPGWFTLTPLGRTAAARLVAEP